MSAFKPDPECCPIDTVTDLLQIRNNPMCWWLSVEPLQARSIAYNLKENFYDSDTGPMAVADSNRAQMLICHDYRGGYLSDKHLTDAVKFDEYRFYNWAGCDIFCYFSHRFITIPTLQWLNAAHKHGVKVLGTFIVEWNDGKKMINEEILSSVAQAKRVADALVYISKACNFEGWLINVESPVEEANIPVLIQFLEYLTQQTRALIPNGMIIWYDSVIKSGELKWQNELNDENRVFFESCDGIFLNYNWRDEHLVRSQQIIQKSYPNRQHDVFVGIDVFGRGQVAKWQSHETLAQIRSQDFSVAIFAPGWTWESLSEKVSLFNEYGTDDCNKRFLENNDTFWRLLWPHLVTNAVTQLPFHTTFCLGSGKFQNCRGLRNEAQSWFNLTKQSLQISVPIGDGGVSRCFEDSFDGGCCLKLTYNEGAQQRLFVCDFDCSQGLLVTFAVKCENEAVDVDFILHVVDRKLDQIRKIVCSKKLSPVDDTAVHLPLLESNELDTLNLKTSVNGWEMRHFYLNFETKFDFRLCDIGVRVAKTHDVVSAVRLGAITVEQCVVSSLDLKKITM